MPLHSLWRPAIGLAIAIAASVPSATDTRAAEIRVLSGGAVEPGLHAFADVVRRDTGHTLAIQFNTGPQIAKRLEAADSVVYNTASTGLYLDKLFERLGIVDTVKAKATRYADGASVMEHVIRGKGAEIGFGAMTEIRLYESKGLTMIGPLPPDAQNFTAYEAAVMTGAKNAEAARDVLRLIATPAGTAAFVSGGVE